MFVTLPRPVAGVAQRLVAETREDVAAFQGTVGAPGVAVVDPASDAVGRSELTRPAQTKALHIVETDSVGWTGRVIVNREQWRYPW